MKRDFMKTTVMRVELSEQFNPDGTILSLPFIRNVNAFRCKCRCNVGVMSVQNVGVKLTKDAVNFGEASHGEECFISSKELHYPFSEKNANLYDQPFKLINHPTYSFKFISN